jgi:hypothetical protein
MRVVNGCFHVIVIVIVVANSERSMFRHVAE